MGAFCLGQIVWEKRLVDIWKKRLIFVISVHGKYLGNSNSNSTNPYTNPNIIGKKYKYLLSSTPNTNSSTNIHILDMTNTNMTIFGYLRSKYPQSFGTQIYLYPIMQVLKKLSQNLEVHQLTVRWDLQKIGDVRKSACQGRVCLVSI